ncbi:MAG: hypothetical protein RL009_913 [Actinomycetota bacterium]
MEHNAERKINWDNWLREIRAIGFANPLLNFEPNSIGQIDLERAHPSGLAQLSSSRNAVLSNLFRDPLAFSRSYSAARRIRSRADFLDTQFGVHALGLAAGLVNLEHDGFDLSLPIVLWEAELDRKTDDFEIRLVGKPRVNPGLMDAIEDAYGVKLDPQVILSSFTPGADFVPLSMLEYIASRVGAAARLETRRILAIGNFACEPIELYRDVDRHESKLLRSISGLEEPQAETSSWSDSHPIDLVSDADSVQQRVVAMAASGRSFAVETLPGCGYTQTVVNVIAALASEGKSVLVVAPRRQTLHELADRFASLGLGGLAVRESHTWFDLIAAIGRHEKTHDSNLALAKVRREAATVDIENYLQLLGKRDEKVQLTVSEALVALAKLSLVPRAPETSARIAPSLIDRHRNRTEAMGLLLEAQELGEFDHAPSDSAWFQARFEDERQAEQAVSLATRLDTEGFAAFQSQLDAVTAQVNFKPATSVEDWGAYLRLLSGIRETLGRFVPEVFQRPIEDLIIATGPRTAQSEMSGSNRRRLKKLAKEYLRPGMHVTDIHEALLAVQEQREQWSRFCVDDSQPQVPSGISDLLVAYQAFVSDLARLQSHQDDDPKFKPLVKLALSDLRSTLHSMANDLAPLSELERRNAIRTKLKEAGLAPLARNLAQLKVKREHISLELELAWWQSALEYLVARDSSVMRYTAEQIDTIEEDFTLADSEVVRQGAPALAAKLAEKWRALLASNPDQAGALKAMLRSKSAAFASLYEAAPDFASLLLQVVMLSPYQVPSKLPKNKRFDTLLVLDAAGSTVSENLAALSRANQVIAFGDDAIAAPDGFEMEWHETPLVREDSPKSVFDEVKSIFGGETLRKSWRPNGQTLGSVINREFYQNRIDFAPTAGEFLGQSNLRLEILKSGIGSTTKGVAAIESPDVEVERVVALVLDHAKDAQQESLLVVTASKLHSERIESALSKALKHHTELEEWFDSHGREKFEVTSIGSLSHRVADHIIFSVGFGVDSADKAPASLGDLSATAGRRYLANMLVSARNRITVVSCLTPESFDSETGHSAQGLLAQVLASGPAHALDETDTDPLLEDLSLRLKKLGARALLNYGDAIPLAVSYANKAAVVLPDWNLAGEGLTERLRLRPALLRAMGWKVIRVHTFELFADPAALAIRIGESLGMQLTKRPQPLFDQPAFDDSPEAWGERSETNDARLQSDKPPHWG